MDDRTFAAALVLTLVVEAPIVLLGMRKVARSAVQLLLIFALVNAFTHAAFYIIWPQVAGTFEFKLAVFESSIAIAEGMLYGLICNGAFKRGLAVSILANAVSLAASLLYFRLPDL